MKKLAILTSVLALTTLGNLGTAWATSASGTVAVSVTVASSLNMVFQTDASGLALTGTGTSAVTASFGTMSAYGGTVPTGVTRTLNGTTSWTISTPFDVIVTIANQTSSNYTLTAQLQTSDAVNTWKINTTTVTSSTPSSLTTTGNYGNTAYTLGLTIPFSEAATTISNTINFVATAN
jgi:hypothetical protein